MPVPEATIAQEAAKVPKATRQPPKRKPASERKPDALPGTLPVFAGGADLCSAARAAMGLCVQSCGCAGAGR